MQMRYIVHTVENESLTDIERRYGIDKRTILNDSFASPNSVNDVLRNGVHKGMRLIIRKANETVYIVQPFDTLQKIAEKFGADVKELELYNGTDKVFLGQQIHIPE